MKKQYNFMIQIVLIILKITFSNKNSQFESFPFSIPDQTNN